MLEITPVSGPMPSLNSKHALKSRRSSVMYDRVTEHRTAEILYYERSAFHLSYVRVSVIVVKVVTFMHYTVIYNENQPAPNI
jgi:hypothetical protein